MPRQCVLLFGPPCTGKSETLASTVVARQKSVAALDIGDHIRASDADTPPDQLARRALEAACAALPHDGVLLLNGVKRASHAIATLKVLARHNVKLVAAYETRVRYYERPDRQRDDAALDARRARYALDRPMLRAAARIGNHGNRQKFGHVAARVR